MDLEKTIEELKEQGVGYLYSWSYDKIWSFGSTDNKLILPYLDGSDLDLDKIEPISRIKSFLLGIPWYHVANLVIANGEKVDKMQNKMRGRNIFFHVPLPKRFDRAHHIFNNPFIIWNRIRGDKDRKYAGNYLTIVGEYDFTSILSQEMSSGEEGCIRGVRSLFEIPEPVLRDYTNQKTFELYDPTKSSRLNVVR